MDWYDRRIAAKNARVHACNQAVQHLKETYTDNYNLARAPKRQKEMDSELLGLLQPIGEQPRDTSLPHESNIAQQSRPFVQDPPMQFLPGRIEQPITIIQLEQIPRTTDKFNKKQGGKKLVDLRSMPPQQKKQDEMTLQGVRKDDYKSPREHN
ncbi:hypothetical protein VCV18_009555 [Metarhizium anisopliae]